MNRPEYAGFMATTENEIETLIKMKAFVVVEKEP